MADTLAEYNAVTESPGVTAKMHGIRGSDALAVGVRDVAKKTVAGIDPYGPLATAHLKAHQRVHMDVTLPPGKCYAIVGFSASVTSLRLELWQGQSRSS